MNLRYSQFRLLISGRITKFPQKAQPWSWILKHTCQSTHSRSIPLPFSNGHLGGLFSVQGGSFANHCQQQTNKQKKNTHLTQQSTSLSFICDYEKIDEKMDRQTDRQRQPDRHSDWLVIVKDPRSGMFGGGVDSRTLYMCTKWSLKL